MDKRRAAIIHSVNGRQAITIEDVSVERRRQLYTDGFDLWEVGVTREGRVANRRTEWIFCNVHPEGRGLLDAVVLLDQRGPWNYDVDRYDLSPKPENPE